MGHLAVNFKYIVTKNFILLDNSIEDNHTMVFVPIVHTKVLVTDYNVEVKCLSFNSQQEKNKWW